MRFIIILLVFCVLCLIGIFVFVAHAYSKSNKMDAHNEKALADAPASVRGGFEKLTADISIESLPKELMSDVIMVGHIKNMHLTLSDGTVASELMKAMTGAFHFVLFPNYLVAKGLCLPLDIYTGCSCTAREEMMSSGSPNTNEDKQKSVIGSAAVGGVLFGGAGAVVGAIAAADHNSRLPATQSEKPQNWNVTRFCLSFQRKDGATDTLDITFPQTRSQITSNYAEYKFIKTIADVTALFSRAIPNGRNLNS